MGNQLNYQIWVLAGGRLLLQIGNGFTLFYAPIFFVNQVGFSATSVGLALGSASLSGIVGRFCGGSFSDSPQWGRRGTLLLSAAISAIADIFLALTYNLPVLVIGNLLMGLGIGLYWPAAEAAVADLTTSERRNEAFALTRLADSIGLGMGVALGGALIAFSQNYRALFVIDGISFLLFYLIVYGAIAETYQFKPEHQQSAYGGWLVALGDRSLWVFVAANIFFTTYIAQVQTTLPLYLTNFAARGGLGVSSISGLFTLHIAFAALFQLPVVRWLNQFSRIHGLMVSLVIWGFCFLSVWVTGNVNSGALGWGTVSVMLGAIAMVAYNPCASALIVDLSPPSLRGIYFAVNSQCWAIGYLIGPPLGGWILDRGAIWAHNFWLVASASIAVGILVLWYLQVTMRDGDERI